MAGRKPATTPVSGLSSRSLQALSGAQPLLRAVGLRSAWWADLYHYLLILSWPRFLVGVAALYVVVNLVFAGLFRLGGDNIHNARPGSFLDAFYLSVQTFGTIGYGYLAPKTDYANLVVAVEGLVGLLSTALVTGLMFARFARPTARVMFSRQAVFTKRDGDRVLQFRIANERGNQIAEAQVMVSLSRNEVTREGESIRRIYDLELVRSKNTLFVFSWTVMHRIDERSPFSRLDGAELERSAATVIVSLTGLDDVLGQTIHARHIYRAADLLDGHRLVDVLELQPDGSRIVNYHRFHDVEAEATKSIEA